MNQGYKKSRKITWFVLANVAVLLFLAVAFGREYIGNKQVQREIKQLEEERITLENDHLNTLKLIEDLSSEYYLESEARTKHGLGLEGEKLIVVQTGDESESGLNPAQSNKLIPNPKRWFYYFFNKEAFDDLAKL